MVFDIEKPYTYSNKSNHAIITELLNFDNQSMNFYEQRGILKRIIKMGVY